MLYSAVPLLTHPNPNIFPVKQINEPTFYSKWVFFIIAHAIFVNGPIQITLKSSLYFSELSIRKSTAWPSSGFKNSSVIYNSSMYFY